MTGIANAVNGPESAPYLAKSGGTMTGAINMGAQLITNGAIPVSAGDLTTKSYVDNIVLNVNPACLCASTTALTVLYDNGSSGVGATLTNAGAFAVFSVDGVSPSVGQRVLIKDQASELQNGVYTVTVVGDAVSVNWVLTRATNYDESADMQAGDKFSVVSGTTQEATEWMMNQTAAITVGVTSITFVEVGQVEPSITSVVQQIFTANGTYTPTTGMVYCMIECIGSGGGGGGGAGVLATSIGAAGGGGGGAYSRSFKTATDVGASQSVTIGAAGSGGAAGNNNGSNGNTTSVGTLVTALGGSGGQGSPAIATLSYGGDGGAGGTTGGTGEFKIPGGAGSFGIILDAVNGVAVSGKGGSSFFGTGGANQTATGNVGAIYGSGGAGANAAGGDVAGNAGAAGVVVITEYVSISA